MAFKFQDSFSASRRSWRKRRRAHVPAVRIGVRLAVLASLLCGGFGADQNLGLSNIASGSDWPQLLGSERDGVARGERLPDELQGEPKVEWNIQVGQGYAGPAVVGDRVLIFHRPGTRQQIDALDRSTGKWLWSTDLAAPYAGGINPDRGPRCVPLVADGTVYLFGAAGFVHAVNLQDGKLVWSRDLYGDLDGREGYFGAGSTPILIGDRLLINAGGRNGAGIVALSSKQGKLIWKATSEAASYSSPIKIEQERRELAFFVTRLNALLIDPSEGRVIAQRPFGARGPTVNAAAPLRVGQHLFLTASYGVGAALVDPADPQLKPQWENDRSLSSQYNTPLAKDGYLYGIHGREDIGTAALRCVEAKTGRVVWSQENFGVAHLVRANDRALALHVDGRISLFDLAPARLNDRGQWKLPVDVTRALPAYSDGVLFVKSERELLALRVHGSP